MTDDITPVAVVRAGLLVEAEALTPPPYREDTGLLVEALRRVARMQHETGQGTFARGVRKLRNAGVFDFR